MSNEWDKVKQCPCGCGFNCVCVYVCVCGCCCCRCRCWWCSCSCSCSCCCCCWCDYCISPSSSLRLITFFSFPTCQAKVARFCVSSSSPSSPPLMVTSKTLCHIPDLIASRSSKPADPLCHQWLCVCVHPSCTGHGHLDLFVCKYHAGGSGSYFQARAYENLGS